MANNKYILTIDGNDYRFLGNVTIDGCDYSLEKLSYDKGIYRPAEMTVVMNVSGSATYDKLYKAFYMKSVSLKVEYKDNQDKKTKNAEVAKHYFVYKVKPQFQTVAAKSSVKLELTIYSQDKLMTLDKYSKAWTSQRLGKDVLEYEKDEFKYDGKSIDVGYDLQIIDNGSHEFMQPYLIQYNESFYDFLRRTSNRCGEFLYHEDGQLHLGIKVLKDNKDTDFAKLASSRYYEDIVREGTKTSDYGFNYLKDHANPDGKPYSDPLTYDDYLDDIDPQITSTFDEMGRWNKNLVSSICMALEGTSFSKIISNIGLDYAFKAAHAAVEASNVNAAYMEENIAPWTGKPDHANAGKTRQFGTAPDQSSRIVGEGSTINLTSKFYSLVRKAEKKVSENAVWLEFEDKTQNLRIGDQIKVDGTDYLVIGVKGSCRLTTTLEKAQLPHLEDVTNYNYEESQQVTAIRFYPVGTNALPLPPVLADAPIRVSQAQLAFVVNTLDPKEIGRVRVRMAWQPEDAEASPWIRVQLPFATDGAGVKFKPEEGDEVMVSFEEGNIERPYVSGFLLSPRSNKSWGSLPDRSIISKNGHGITFDDGGDGGTFFYQLYPGIEMVKGFFPNASWPDTLTSQTGCQGLAGGMTLSDRFGLYRISLSSDSREVAIQSAMGDVKLSAFTGITISAPNGDIEIKGKNVSIEASNTVKIESGTAIKNRFVPDANHVYQEKGSKFWNSLGRTFVDIGVDGARGVMSRTVDQVLDLNLIRTVMEVVLRPIDGTTRIKSFTFVQVEAGKGSTEYPDDARRDGDRAKDIENFMKAIDTTASTIGTRIEAIHRAHNRMCEAISAFKEAQSDLEKEAISLDDVKSSAWKKQKGTLNYDWDKAHLTLLSDDDINQAKNDAINQTKNELGMDHAPNKNDDKYKNIDEAQRAFVVNQDLIKWNARMHEIDSKAQQDRRERDQKQTKQNKIKDAAEQLQTTVNDLYLEIKHGFCSEDGIQSPAFLDDVKKAVKNQSFKDIGLNDIKKDSMAWNAGHWDKRRKHYKREAVRALLADTSIGKKLSKYDLSLGNPGSKDGLDDASNWKDMVNNLLDKNAVTTFQQEKQKVFKNWFGETFLDPWSDSTVNRKRWKVGVEGKILLSDHPGKTITFNGKGDPKAQWNIVATDKLAGELEAKLMTIE